MTNMKTPIYQYSKKNNEKVFRYSSDKSLADSTWAKDDVAFYASNKPAENLVPVYEYHAGSDSSFRYLYTTDPNASQGWKNEAGNIAFYASATEMPNTTPIILFHKESNGWYFRYSAYEQVDNDWTVNPTPVFYASAPAPNRVQINKGGYVSIPHNEAYNFGKGAFSVMAYITPNKVENGQTELTAGTIVSSKPQPGGNGNGGWQFFLEKEGEALMLCFKTDDGHGYHLLKAPLNNLYDDKAIRSPNNVAADVERAKKLFKEYTHFVAAVRGASGDMNLYVNGYLIARATPFEPTSNSMSTDGSFQLKGIFKESIDKPTHYFTVKKNASTYITGTADWDKDGFTPVGASFSLTSVPSSKVNTLTAEQQQNKDVSTITTKIEKVIPAQNMIAANRVSLFIKPTTGQQQEKLLAQFAANVGPSENVDNSIGLSIGRTEQYSDPYQGRVKHVSIWKTALEQAEIISYMDSKISENDNSNCVGFWKLETDCKDSTSIGNAGQKESGNTYFIFKDQVLPVYVEEQQKQNWCWAASTLSVIEFYDPMNQLTQSQIVTKKYGTEADQGAWMNDYLKDYYPHHLDHSYFLKDRADLGKGTFISKEDQELDCDFLRKQINNGNPMGLDIQWANGGGHAVMLTGIQPRTGELIINDPWSGLVFITYEDFVNGKYLTNGSWNAVFTTTGSN